MPASGYISKMLPCPCPAILYHDLATRIVDCHCINIINTAEVVLTIGSRVDA